MIGSPVVKHSGKPFKSGNKVNVVKDVIPHPVVLGEWAFTFVDDDSFVACMMCERN
jgi:hypothetical protein